MGLKDDKSKSVKKRKNKNGDSSINIGDKNKIEDTVIGQNINNITIIKTIPDHSVNYEVDKEDVDVRKNSELVENPE
ncbi:MAG TPA: hypothetical protein VF360_02195 [Candidatus Methanoperedens sp.]